MQAPHQWAVEPIDLAVHCSYSSCHHPSLSQDTSKPKKKPRGAGGGDLDKNGQARVSRHNNTETME